MDTDEAKAQTDPVTVEDQNDASNNTQETNSLGGTNDDFLTYEQEIEALRLGENQDEANDLGDGQEGIESEKVEEPVATEPEGETEEPEAQVSEEPEELDEESESEAKKPSRYRFSDLSDVEHRAMELKKRNVDLSLAECLDIAKQEIEPEGDKEYEQQEPESSQIKAQINELREKYNTLMDDYDVDEAKAVNMEIESLRDQLQETLVAEGIRRVESRLDERRSEESYEESLQSSFNKASEVFPEFADQNSALSILAAKIAKANSIDDPAYNESPDKPFLAAKEAAEILGITQGKPQVAKPTQQAERPNFPARGGAKTATQPPQTNNIESLIDSVTTTDEFEALMERIG